MRFFKNRTEVDKVCLMDGELPSETGEIAIDRMYADNNSLKIGDTLDDQITAVCFRIITILCLML